MLPSSDLFTVDCFPLVCINADSRHADYFQCRLYYPGLTQLHLNIMR